MTNYNERLDEQLNYLMEYSYKYGKGEIPSNENPPLIIARGVKQAITSLIKELVAEAKPARVHGTTVSSGQFNRGVSAYEQNLLKALEEKI